MPVATSTALSSQTPTPTSTPPRPPHTHTPQPPTSPVLFRTLESYPWTSDPAFLSGLQAILGPSQASTSPSSPTATAHANGFANGVSNGISNGDTNGNGITNGSRAHPTAPTAADQRTTDLTLRARCFYYTRAFDQAIDFDAYAAWRAAQPVHSLSPIHASVSASTAATSLDLSTNAASTSSTPSTNGHSSHHNDSPNVSTISTLDDSISEGTEVEAEVEGETQPSPSFAEIMHLIQTNQPIPGVRQIPSTVLEGQGTVSRLAARAKPWERAAGGGGGGGGSAGGGGAGGGGDAGRGLGQYPAWGGEADGR